MPPVRCLATFAVLSALIMCCSGKARPLHRVPLPWTAVYYGTPEQLEQSIAKGGDPNRIDNKTKGAYIPRPLHVAAQRDSPEIMKVLLRHGADPNGRDSDGRSAMHEAAVSGSIGCAKLLVKFGANVNLADHRGITALGQAEGLLLSYPLGPKRRAKVLSVKKFLLDHGGKMRPVGIGDGV